MISPDDSRAETGGDADSSKELQKDTQTLCIVTNPRITQDFRALKSWYSLCSLWHHTDPGPITWAQTSCCLDFWLNGLNMLAWCLVAALVSVRI